MKRNDEILRYLSDLMSEGEKNKFESELSSSEELRAEFELLKSRLDGLKNDSEISSDSPYFQNLLPRVRVRIEKKKKLKWVPRLAYIVPTATAVILLAINTGKFLPDGSKAAADTNITASKTEVKTEGSHYYPDYNLSTNWEYAESVKGSSVSFEVGISEISNKESLKNIAKERIAYPVEDYLLALR